MNIEDIALTMVHGLGVKGVVHLLECFGSAEHVFAQPLETLVERAELREDVARNIVSHSSFAEAEREMDYCRRHNITPIASTDADYPQIMRETDDYPHVIYVCGSVGALAKRTIAFVGTRRMTPYGELACSRLVGGLAERLPDLCIVSGLAYGIDAAAHRAAIAAGAATVAVVANPLPGVTPTAHADLARDIIDHGGAIISELPSNTKQNGSFFISRNRIMAALGYGTVVVESDSSGGSLVTARMADGYNRSVMAVPGRITDRFSSGTNMLIRNRKAQAVLSADDIISELMWELELPTEPAPEADAEADRALLESLLPDERRILEAFGNADTLSGAELAARCAMNFGELSAHLMSMEIAGLVRQLPGNMFEKLLNITI